MMKGMSRFFLVLGLMLLLIPVFARTISIVNSSGQTICPGMQGSTVPNGGGWCQNNGTTVNVTVPDNWAAARIWGRTGCNTSTGLCETGDCGSKIACGGAGGIPPATLSEWTLQGYGGLDYYDMSLVDGYNLPMKLQNVGGTKSGNGTQYDCGTAQCTSDLNASCPAALQFKNSAGKVVACKSACEAFNTDQYCCRNAYGTPATCPPTSYSQAFKAACPTAYSYAYDDAASTYTCIGGNYTVTFTATSSSTSSSGTSSSSSSKSSSSSSKSSSSSSKSSSSSSVSSSTSSGTISLPGTVSSSVGAIASGTTKTWNVNLSSAGNYRIQPTFAGTANGQTIVVTLRGIAVTISANPGQTPNVDFANLPAGATTLTIKANNSGVNLGKVAVVKY